MKECCDAGNESASQERHDAPVITCPVFISYKRHVEPDAPLAQALHQVLSVHHNVFLDQTTPVGTRWGERIDTALRETDFLLVLLSAESVRSEMVMAEVEKVYYRARAQAGHPTLLPVRLAYGDPLPYPLSAYLNFITAALWSGPDDTPRLMAEILQGHSWHTVVYQHVLATSESTASGSAHASASPSSATGNTWRQPQGRFEVLH